MTEQFLTLADKEILNPKSVLGAVFYAAVFLGIAAAAAAGIGRLARRLEPSLSDVTALRFVAALTKVVVYLIGFIAYAHLVPELRALGTALLAGVSVMSLVVGLAAQNTLANLVAGISLVLYRPIRIGDIVQLDSPKGLITATVKVISLGFTALRTAEGHEVIVPNSVMMGSVVIRLTGDDAARGGSGSH